MQLSNMYQEVILDHYKTPRGKGLQSPFGEKPIMLIPLVVMK